NVINIKNYLTKFKLCKINNFYFSKKYSKILKKILLFKLINKKKKKFLITSAKNTTPQRQKHSNKTA
ncbi:hypothetical protein Mgra_00002426, partial [Meloidogyne graminicola]